MYNLNTPKLALSRLRAEAEYIRSRPSKKHYENYSVGFIDSWCTPADIDYVSPMNGYIKTAPICMI